MIKKLAYSMLGISVMVIAVLITVLGFFFTTGNVPIIFQYMVQVLAIVDLIIIGILWDAKL